MKESVWGYFVIAVGIIIIFLIFFFQNITNTDEHNMALLKSVTESSMNDAVDWETYQEEGTLRINEKVFIESFIRRFAEDAQLASNYKIEFYKVQEEPPLINIKVYTSVATESVGGNVSYRLANSINAILETDPNRKGIGTNITTTITDDEEVYRCGLDYNNQRIALYDKTNKSKVVKAYIDGVQVSTNQVISINGSQVTAYIQTGMADEIHTGNLTYEDGHVATCTYTK